MQTSAHNAAVEASLAVANAFGLPARTATLIGGYSNTLLKLEPLPLVARVAAATMTVRPGVEWMKREVAVADFLSANGARCVRPSQLLPPGPHCHDSLNMTFWDYLETGPNPPEPTQTGILLRDLHDALSNYPETLPRVTPLAEALSMLESPDLKQPLQREAEYIVSRAVERVRVQMDRHVLECRPLHGDAHYGNLWQTADGFFWGDFEDACSGPIEWDVACMVTSSLVFGPGSAAASAIQGYGRELDLELLDLLVEARTLQGIAWALISLPEPATNPRLQKRLNWLALRG